MESKETPYGPLMSPDETRDSAMDDSGSSSDKSLLERYQRRRRWRSWVPSPVLGSVIILILLTLGLIITVLTHKPTDLQCTKQLSMYCEFAGCVLIPRPLRTLTEHYQLCISRT